MWKKDLTVWDLLSKGHKNKNELIKDGGMFLDIFAQGKVFMKNDELASN